jgi:hypothetical protein
MKEESKGSRMTISEYKAQFTEKWDDVRPVVIYFAGERFVVEYDERFDRVLTPVVAMVHSYLGNITLTQNDN